MKMKNKKMFTVLAMLPMALASCGQKSASGAFTVCLASQPDTIDPALNSSVDGGTYDEHLFEGLYRWSYTGTYPNGSVSLVPGLVADNGESVVNNDDGTVTYTYTLREGLKWSDGTSLTASDIVRSWKRAVSGGDDGGLGADYAYLFEAVNGGYDAEEEADGASLSVSATNDTTLVTTLATPISYWHELLAFPAFAPVPSAAGNDGSWCAYTKGSSIVTNGPMKIKAFNTTKLELVPNEYYHDTSIVKAEDVTFAFSDDSTAMLNSFNSGSYSFIDDVPVAQIDELKTRDEYFNVGQLGTYYLCWNIDSTVFDGKLATEAERQLFRKAVCLLIDRTYIIDNVAKGGQKPADGFVSEGLTEADGSTDWTAKNGTAADGSGYFDASSTAQTSNEAAAVQILKGLGFTQGSDGKFTGIPSFEYLYNTSDGHKAIGEAVQQMLAKYGITMTLTNQDWKTFLTTRKTGNYTFARNGWLCDYNDPISMLDMWTSQSGNNDVQFGKGRNATEAIYECDLDGDGVIASSEKGLTWAQSFDVLIATIKATADNTLRFKLMHAAEDLLMSTWTLTPVYYYTDLFMKSTNLEGYFGMPLGYKFFYGATLTA